MTFRRAYPPAVAMLLCAVLLVGWLAQKRVASVTPRHPAIGPGNAFDSELPIPAREVNEQIALANRKADDAATRASRMKTAAEIANWIAFGLTLSLTLASAFTRRPAAATVSEAHSGELDAAPTAQNLSRPQYVVGLLAALATCATATATRCSQIAEVSLQQLRTAEALGQRMEQVGSGNLEPPKALSEFHDVKVELMAMQ